MTEGQFWLEKNFCWRFFCCFTLAVAMSLLFLAEKEGGFETSVCNPFVPLLVSSDH